MNFVTIGLLTAGYTLMYWGWDAFTDRVNVGNPGQIWWPSIKDLVIPANYGKVPTLGFQTQGVTQQAQQQSSDATTAAAGGTTTITAGGNSTQVPTSGLVVA